MEEVGKMLASPIFWVGTVIAGLLVNFASQWMYGHLAAMPGKFGDWRRKRSEKRRAAFDRDKGRLAQHPELIPLYVAEEMRLRLVAVVLAVLAGVILIFASGFSSGAGSFSLSLIASVRTFFSAAAAVIVTLATMVFDRADVRADVLRAIYRDAIKGVAP